ncbi:MAG: exonuclease domain-containing protein [Bacteroidota bacterium]
MYAILDIETTGGKYNEEGITEIAIHRFDGHQVVDKFISLVNPEREIQPYVANLTGITTKMLRTAPKFHEVAKRIVEITEGTTLVAHNAQFDYRILRTEFRRLGYNFERKSLCTVDLAKRLIPNAESHSLGKLVRSLGIPVSDRHRANGDALATLKLFKVLLSKDADKSIIKEIVRAESHGELSPRQLDIVEQMPSETGLYYMYNKEGEIIFLGKSRNIKKRVNQHFIKNGSRGRRLQKETKKVVFEKTGNELVALLKEYEELRVNHPKYMEKRSPFLFSHGICVATNENGYRTLTVKAYDPKNEPVITFNSFGTAEKLLQEITDEFQLCPKLNGLDHNKDDCSRLKDIEYEEGYNRMEEPVEYNSRVHSALDKYSLKGKSILVLDKGRETGEHSVILLKNGVLQGLGFYDLNHQINNIHILESIITPIKGDVNTTHIIGSYLRKKRVYKILDVNP